ncbi:hypothetical protein GF357_02070 [Candidatus Dojkabacteria bacterium]|nr:hypothetical protein [Candidatus Dojkabacteria bacterium]
MQPKKSLGQNFFCNKNLAQKIASTAVENNPEFLIEIGPGTGSFTQLFTQFLAPDKILGIEKDDEIAQKWDSHFQEIPLLHKDILKVDLGKLICKQRTRHMGNKTYTFSIFGSLPYNISKKIIRKILVELALNPEFSDKFTAYFIIQKEVAQKYQQWQNQVNSLALLTKVLSDVKTQFYINHECFRPRPKVESAFVKFTPNQLFINQYPDFTYSQLTRKYKDFHQFVLHCFSNPRKTLFNNLKSHVKDDVLIKTLNTRMLSKRPHELKLDEFLTISQLLSDA